MLNPQQPAEIQRSEQQTPEEQDARHRGDVADEVLHERRLILAVHRLRGRHITNSQTRYGVRGRKTRRIYTVYEYDGGCRNEEADGCGYLSRWNDR